MSNIPRNGPRIAARRNCRAVKCVRRRCRSSSPNCAALRRRPLMKGMAFVIYYANYALFATHLQLDLKLSPALVALPIALANTAFFLSSLFWGWLAERIGRRWAIIIPAAPGGPTAFPYILT